MSKIDDIKNAILADHIHMAERYPKVTELCEEAEKDLHHKSFPDQSPLAFFEQIADSIEKLKELKQLVAEMKKKYSGLRLAYHNGLNFNELRTHHRHYCRRTPLFPLFARAFK